MSYLVSDHLAPTSTVKIRLTASDDPDDGVVEAAVDDFEVERYEYEPSLWADAYAIPADMGGAGFVFSGENDADIMHNSALINLNMVEACYKAGVKKVFYSSSACMYPEYNQMDPDNPKCSEDSAYPPRAAHRPPPTISPPPSRWLIPMASPRNRCPSRAP